MIHWRRTNRVVLLIRRTRVGRTCLTSGNLHISERGTAMRFYDNNYWRELTKNQITAVTLRYQRHWQKHSIIDFEYIQWYRSLFVIVFNLFQLDFVWSILKSVSTRPPSVVLVDYNVIVITYSGSACSRSKIGKIRFVNHRMRAVDCCIRWNSICNVLLTMLFVLNFRSWICICDVTKLIMLLCFATQQSLYER